MGSGIYNLSCLYSLRKEKEKALELLEKSLQNKEIEVNHVNGDKDWDNFKKDEDFKKIIKKYS